MFKNDLPLYPIILVNTIFLNTGKKRKKKRCISFWLEVCRVEWDKILGFIAYMEKLDRFTKSTYTKWTRRDSKQHRKQSLGSGVVLTTFLYSIFDGESGKIIFRSQKRNKVENFAHFEKECVFLERRHLSTGRKHLLRLKSSFS